MVIDATELYQTILEIIWWVEQKRESRFLNLGLNLYLWVTQVGTNIFEVVWTDY